MWRDKIIIPETVVYKIIPDRSVDNKKSYDFVRDLHDIYRSPLKRVQEARQDGALYKAKERFWYFIRMTATEISFHFACSETSATYTNQKIDKLWPKATVEQVENRATSHYLPIENTLVCEMKYRRHNIFSLDADWREDTVPINSILGISKDMKEGDVAGIWICIDPVNRMNWADVADKAHEQFKAGKTPKRNSINGRFSLMSLGRGLDATLQEVSNIVDLATEDQSKQKKKRDDVEKREIMIDGHLLPMTRSKRHSPTFRTFIRCVSHSADKDRREITLRALSNAFNELAGDNELMRQEIHKTIQPKLIEEINTLRLSPISLLDFDANVMSCDEIGKLIQLPTASLQDQYRDKLATIDRREVEIPDVLKDGIPFAKITIKGKAEVAHIPTDNWGMLCRPHVGLGVMYTGKSTLGSRMGHLFPENGFTSILMDTADGALIDDARDALPADFPDEHIIDLDLGDLMWSIPSDWNEITSSMTLQGADWARVEVERRKASSKLSSVLINFIDKLAEETSDRMERYLSAVAKGVLTSPQRGILEVIMCLSDDNYRANVLKSFKITDPIVYGTIKELHEMSPETRWQIVRPILTRLNVLMSNDYMRNSILQTPRIGKDGKPLLNVRKWIDGNPATNPKYGGAYFVGIRIPKSELFDMATDRLATFWDAKIWLAALSRYDLPKVNGCHGKPFIYLRDEPHQTPSAYQIHNDACREARKWGMKNMWLAHKLEDFAFMKKTLQDAGAQYSVFATSKGTIRDLKEELKPFEEDELMAIPPQGVCVTKLAQADQAFMCETFRIKKVKDRSYIRKICSKKYGRPLAEVEKEIFEKTSGLMATQSKK